MRTRITGLKQAQNNAKSGINLVQTAEGALQEVQDMLNRMVKLAGQSANGTYDLSGVADGTGTVTIDGKTYTYDTTNATDGKDGKFKDLTTLKAAIAVNDTAGALKVTGTDLTSVKIEKTSTTPSTGTGGSGC